MSNPYSMLLLSSIPRTASINSSNDGAVSRRPTYPQRAHFILDVASFPAAESLVLRIQAEDYFGKWYDVLVSSPITDSGIYIFKVGVGFPAVPNLSASDMLPDVWRVRIEHSGGGAWVYGLSANIQNG